MIQQYINIIVLTCFVLSLFGQNPIVPNQGLNDPHIHIFNDTAYVYASHDLSANNTTFIMQDWWIWSSPDLVNWTKRSVLNPEDTYIGEPYSGCWATDVAEKNGKYYWYFSERNKQTGVVVGDTPVGPWIDPLGRPLLEESLTPTHEYDVSIYEEGGAHFIIFGVWDYYIAKLNPDMISLAEEPRKINICNPRGPYNSDGTNMEQPSDDKPFLHRYNGRYYLSWGCFYAMSDSLYGPYDYKGTVIKEESFAEGYDSPTWPHGFLQGRHGSFFEWHGQWYYAYCDISQTGNRYFRDTFISYIHYKENGEIATIRVDGVGVGRYVATSGVIESEDFFRTEGFEKKEYSGGFAMVPFQSQGYLSYPNIVGLDGYNKISMHIASPNGSNVHIILRKDDHKGEIIGTKKVHIPSGDITRDVVMDISELGNAESIVFQFENLDKANLIIDSFSFEK